MQITDVRTSTRLLTKLRETPSLSARDLLEQRVSFVVGAMPHNSGVTKERVRQVLLEQSGITVATESR